MGTLIDFGLLFWVIFSPSLGVSLEGRCSNNDMGINIKGEQRKKKKENEPPPKIEVVGIDERKKKRGFEDRERFIYYSEDSSRTKIPS